MIFQLPWSVKNIFIQENVFGNFTRKLKHEISQLKVGSSDKKNTDITYPNTETLEKLNEITGKARSEGVEVFQTSGVNNFVPTVFIGPNVFPNNVIKEDLNVPLVTLNSFRTISEAVTLSNNTRQGLGISIWTESTSLVHEIVDKLKVHRHHFNISSNFLLFKVWKHMDQFPWTIFGRDTDLPLQIQR